ncbi:hypothetical protein GAP86_19020 [Salmonella enterica]|nr:hypothetical protein [Salmonella enterica]
MLARLVSWFKQRRAKAVEWPPITHDDKVVAFLNYSEDLTKLGGWMCLTERQVFAKISSSALRKEVFPHLSVMEQIHAESVEKFLSLVNNEAPRIRYLTVPGKDVTGQIDFGRFYRTIKDVGYTHVKRLSETSVVIYHRREYDLLGCVIKLTHLNRFYVDLLTEFYPEPWCFIDENK